MILYGRPPLVFDPPGTATQTSPLIPGSTALESLPDDSVEGAMIYAPPGVLERRYTLAQALRALKVGGRLDVMAPKDRGGSRLKKELEAFGLEVGESAKAHHRRCVVVKPGRVTGIEEAIAGASPQTFETDNGQILWTQPGVFAWDRIDAGSAFLEGQLLHQGSDMGLKGAGADLGCGTGVLSWSILDEFSKVTSLRMIDIDRRAIEMAKKNVIDPRAQFEWADARSIEGTGDLNFIVMNPPFHDGGAETKRLGLAFIQKAAQMLTKGGELWMVANRHLPYEAELKALFKRVEPIGDNGAFKVFWAQK
ncbi:class I SAM-dependent methyltransferase [Brevundimonas sp. AJA228-03]|uniref:class I SAM-dependent methyltransferase n=1 Tax=Brevundimonas sp. AJA228-03 TaxID=2752515 RepID=UPI0035301BD7